MNARLLVDTLRGAVIVPTAAIQRSPQSTFVYVVKPDNTVEMRNVKVRLTEGRRDGDSQRRVAGRGGRHRGVDKLQPGDEGRGPPAGRRAATKAANE